MELHVIVAVRARSLKRLEWNISSGGYFLNGNSNTSRDSGMENPFLLLRFLSNRELMRYLDEPGEQVRSLVKSDFLPQPMPLPTLVRVDLES